MKAVSKLLAFSLLILLSAQSNAQIISVTLKSFSNPFLDSNTEYVMDANTTASFSCNPGGGPPIVNSLRFRSNVSISLDQSTGSQVGSGNASFIMFSEVISAAKNGYLIDLNMNLGVTYTGGKCTVTYFFVRLQ